MFIRNPFNWNLRFGTIPSEFKEAMTYEEQVMWLYYQIKELKEGSANYNYDLLENKPSIDGVILQGNITKTQLGIEQNYNILANKPSINSVPLVGNLSLNELGIQGKLNPGTGIRISGNTISVVGGGSGGTSDYEQLENLPAINGNELIGDKTAIELGLQESLAVDYSQYARQGKKYNMTNIQVGDTIQTPLTFDNQADCDCIVIENKVTGMKFDLYGIYEVLITNANNEVVSIYSTGLEAGHGYAEALSDGGYIIINFENSLYSCNLLFNASYLENLLENTKPKELNNDIVLLDGGIIDMDSGSYYFDENHALYFHSAIAENSIYKSNDGVFYFEFNSQTFYLDNKIYYYDGSEMDWAIMEHSNITNEIVNSRSKIPTSQAVYNALRNISGTSFYTEIDSNITLNADGTITPALSEGYYFLKSPHSITYYDNDTPSTTYVFTNSIFYYDGEDNIKRTGINARTTNQIETRFIYSRGTNSWELDEEDDSSFVRNLSSTSSYLRSSIPATGNDNDVGNINAVRNYVQSNVINYSTTEKVVGTWIDGKPLYEKVVEIPAQQFTGNNATTVPHNISNFKFGFVTQGGLYYTSPTSGLNLYNFGNFYLNGTSIQTNYFYVAIVSINSTNFQIGISQTYSSTLVNGGFAIVRYTKTTD